MGAGAAEAARPLRTKFGLFARQRPRKGHQQRLTWRLTRANSPFVSAVRVWFAIPASPGNLQQMHTEIHTGQNAVCIYLQGRAKQGGWGPSWQELDPIADIPRGTSLKCLSDQPGQGAKLRSSDGNRGTMSRLSKSILAISDRGLVSALAVDCRKYFSIPTVSSGRRVLPVGNRNRHHRAGGAEAVADGVGTEKASTAG